MYKSSYSYWNRNQRHKYSFCLHALSYPDTTPHKSHRRVLWNRCTRIRQSLQWSSIGVRTHIVTAVYQSLQLHRLLCSCRHMRVTSVWYPIVIHPCIRNRSRYTIRVAVYRGLELQYNVIPRLASILNRIHNVHCCQQSNSQGSFQYTFRCPMQRSSRIHIRHGQNYARIAPCTSRATPLGRFQLRHHYHRTR